MEAIIIMISWHYSTMKVGNNSKSGYVERKQNKQQKY